MIEIILKVKNDSGTYWKIDMFWSLSDSRENAKIHTLTMNGEIKYHLLTNLIAVHNSYIEDKTNFDVNFYNNCKNAKPEEYKQLFDELENIVGYNLDPKTKINYPEFTSYWR